MKQIEKFLTAMDLESEQAVLIHNPSNMFYLSGYTGGGALLIAKEHRAIITDFRYKEQAEKESPDFEVLMIASGEQHENVAATVCAQLGIKEIFFEDDYLTVQKFSKWQGTISGTKWQALGKVVIDLREVKAEEELAKMEAACKITGDAFERLLPQVKEGMTEKQLALMLEFDMRSHGADGIAFSTIVAAGVNGSLPHATPGDYQIKRGDMITLDFGAKVGGYCADMTRTIALGEPSAEMKKIYQVVQAAQAMAQDAVMAGKDCKVVDAVARDYIDSQGYEGCFGHGLGHAVGIDIHEDPRFNTVSTATLKAGQVMTVEPGIYVPGVGGVRFENTVVVTETGCRSLTHPTRDLIIVPV